MRRTQHLSFTRHLMVVMAIALLASAFVMVAPGVATSASAQVVDEPVDCANPASDVVVLVDGEALPAEGLIAGTYAFGPGRYNVDEQRVLESDVRITSCDQTDPAVLVAAGTLPALSFTTFGFGAAIGLRITHIEIEFGSGGGIVADSGIALSMDSVELRGQGSGAAVTVSGGASSLDAIDVTVSGATSGMVADGVASVSLLLVDLSAVSDRAISIVGGSEGETPTQAVLSSVYVNDAGIGVFSIGAVTMDVLGGSVTSALVGTQFLDGSGTKTLTDLLLTSNGIGLATEQPVSLSNLEFGGNTIADCQTFQDLLTGTTTGPTDGTCFAELNDDGGIDCAVPPVGSIVLSPGDDLDAALAEGGIVYLRAGTYEVSVEQAISQSVELTSCDLDDRAVLRQIDACQRVVSLQPDLGATGIELFVHDIDIEGGSAGLAVTNGLELRAVRVQIRGVQPFCDSRAVDVSAGASATLTDVQILGAQTGAWFDNASGLLSRVTIDGSQQFGLHAQSTAGGPAPLIQMIDSVVTNTDSNGLGIGGSGGSGVDLLDADLVAERSVFACNEMSNVRSATGSGQSVERLLQLDQSQVGRFADGSTCTATTQQQGVSIVGNVRATFSDLLVADHADVGLSFADDPAAVAATMVRAMITNNGIGLSTNRLVELTSSEFSNNGVDCLTNTVLTGEGNQDEDGSCFGADVGPAFTIAASEGRGGFSQAIAQSQPVLRIERPIGSTDDPDAALVTEFVVSIDDPAEAPGVSFDWSFEGATLGPIPAADMSDLVFETSVPGAFVTSPQSVVIPEGETSVTLQLVPRVDGDTSEAFVLRVLGSDAEVTGVISPTSYNFGIDVLDAAPQIVSGESANITVWMTPARPIFAHPSDQRVPWEIADGAGFVSPTQGEVAFEAVDDPAFVIAFEELTVTALPGLSAEQTVTLAVAGSEQPILLRPNDDPPPPFGPLQAVRPTTGTELEIDGQDVVELVVDDGVVAGGPEQGFVIEAADAIDIDRTATWEIVGAAVGLGIPADPASDLVASAGNAVIPAGETTATVLLEAIGEATPSPVEGFMITVTLQGQSRTLNGIIQPHVFEAAFVPRSGSELDPAMDYPQVPNPGSFIVAEGFDLVFDVVLTPGDPYNFGAGLLVPWLVNDGLPSGAGLAGPEDFGSSTSGDIDFTFGDAADDTAAFMTRTVQLPVLVDDIDDSEEVAVVLLGVPPGFDSYLQGALATGTLIDLEDQLDLVLAPSLDSIILLDGLPAIEVDPATGATIVVLASQPAAEDIELTWVIEGAAVNGLSAAVAADFVASAGTVTIAAGTDRATITIEPVLDLDDIEATESFRLIVGDDLTMPGLIQPDEFEVTITPIDGQGSLALGSEARLLEFDVTMTPAFAFNGDVTLPWLLRADQTFGSVAVADDDFAQTAASIDFSYGGTDTPASATRRLAIVVADDGLAEPDEGFAVEIGDEITFGYVAESPEGSAGIPPSADDSAPFAGFDIDQVLGDITNGIDGAIGELTGNLTLPEWPDQLPVTIVVQNGRATVTYEETFGDVVLGEPDAFLWIVNPTVRVVAAVGLDGSMSAEVTISADTAQFFPDDDGGAIATATDLVGTATSDGTISFTTDEVAGNFGDLDVVLNDVAIVISDDPAVPLLSVADVETIDGVTIVGLRVFRDGRIVIAEVCVTDDNDLVGRVGIAGLGFALEEACLRTDDGGVQTFDVTGVFDAMLGDIVTGISVGDDPDNEGRATFALSNESGNFTPETLGPITVDIGPFDIAGLTATGAITAPGWTNSVLDPQVSGQLSVTGSNLLFDDANLQASVQGTIAVDGPTTTMDLVALASAEVSMADGLVVIEQGELGIDFGVTSTTTTSGSSASTELSITGPTLRAANLAATVTVPGLDDVDGDPVQLDATVTYAEAVGTWTITVDVADDDGWDFGEWQVNQISGELVLDPNGAPGAQVDGELALLVNVSTTADDIVATLDLQINDTVNPGEFVITADGQATWSGSGVPGLTVVNGQLDFGGQATVNLADPAFDIDSFSAVGSFDEASLDLGGFVVTLQTTTVTFDADPDTLLLDVGTAVAAIADPENPDIDLIRLTVQDLTIADDGTVTVGAVEVSNLDNLATSFGLNGILPFELESVGLVFPEEGNFDTFTLRAAGAVDLSSLGDLDVRVAQGVGNLANCDENVDPVVPFEFVISVDSLSQGAFSPQDLQDLSLAVCNVDLGGLLVSGSILLGGYLDGALVPEASATLNISSADADAPLSGAVDIAVDGFIVATDDGATLQLDGFAVVSGSLDDAIVVENASINFAFDVDYQASSGKLAIENARLFDAEAEILRLAVGEIITFEASDAQIFPEAGVVAAFIDPDGTDAGVSVAFGDGLDVLSGWGGSAGNFSILATDDGFDVQVQPNFFVRIDAPADAEVGLPDWLPFTISEVGLQWPEITEPSSLFTLLEDIATSHVLVSGGLVGSEDGWPFTAQVEDLVIDLAVLGDWLSGDLSQSPIVDLQGVLIGIEPRDWGPARIGGGLALGYVPDPGTGEPIWFGRLFGEFGVDGLILGLDMVVSEHGPIAASFRSPSAIPLDPSGLMLSGVSGGLDFDRSIPELPIECGNQQTSTESEFVCADGSSPLALLNDPAYDFDTPRSWTIADIQQAVLTQADRPGGFLPDNVTMYIGGDITHAAMAGVVSGQVRLAANLDARTETQGLRLLGTGNLSVWGIEGLPTPPPGEENVPGGIAGVGVLLDFSDPIAPVFTVAMEFPKGGDWLAAAFPGQAQFGVTIDTEGMALGLALALQTFLVESVNNPLLDQVIVDYAALLDANRSLRVARLLAVDEDTPITPQLLRTELQARLGGSVDDVAPLAQAVVADLLSYGSNPGDLLVNSEYTVRASEPPAPSGVAVRDALFDAARQAAPVLLATANPSLLAQGNAQFQILGVPFGSPQGATLFVDKNQLFFEATGSLTDAIRNSCGLPACAQALYLLGAGVTDELTVGVGIPINLQPLIDGTAFETFDPFGSPWRANVGGSLAMFGFPLANANGVLLGAGQPDAVAQELGSGRYTIAVPASAQEAFIEHGGLLLEANLQLPGFLTDPATRIEQLGGSDCFTFPEDFIDIPGWFSMCVDETTEADTVGAVQLFAPAPPALGDTDWAVDQMYARGELSGSLLSLPLGDIAVEANASGLQLEARPPLVPDTSATRWLFDVTTSELLDPAGDPLLGADGEPIMLPTVGFEGGLTAGDLSLLLAEFGLGELLGLSAVQGEITARGYSPGFDPGSGDELKRQGGIEITARAGIDNLVDDAAFTFRLAPRAPLFTGEPLPFDVEATATITNATLGGLTVESGIASIQVVEGVVTAHLAIVGHAAEFDITGEITGTVTAAGLAGSFAGTVSLPAGLIDDDQGTISASGSIDTSGDFELVLAVEDLDMGPLAIDDGDLRLRRQGDVITLSITAQPGDSDGRVAVRFQGPGNATLFTGSTVGFTIASDGQLAGDIRIGQIGDPSFVALTDLSARVRANFGSGGPTRSNDEIFELDISSGGVTLGFLAEAAPGSFPTSELGGADATIVVQRDGDFSLDVDLRPVDLGILRLEQGNTELDFNDGVLTLRANMVGQLVLGDDTSDIELSGLRLASDGHVSGQLKGQLQVLGTALADIDVSVFTPSGQPGVLRFEVEKVQVLGNGFFAGIDFAGFVETDGDFELTAAFDAAEKISVGPWEVVQAQASGEIRVTNTSARFVGSASFGVLGVLSCSATANLRVYADPGMLGNVDTTCLGSFGFALPAKFEPSTPPVIPVWVYVPDTVTITAPVGATVLARYDLPAARNGVVSCSPAQRTTLFSAMTNVRCAATSPTGQTITADFDIVVERREIRLAGPDFDGVEFIGGLSLGGNRQSTVSNGTTAFLIVVNRGAKPVKGTQTERGRETFVNQGDTVTGATKGAPGTPTKGELESDPLTVFEVETNDDGIALWSFDIPNDFPPGEHTLYISGVRPDGQLFTDVFPIVVEGAASVPRLPAAPTDVSSDLSDTVIIAGLGEASAPQVANVPAASTNRPLAHTGFAGGYLAMVGLWLTLLGSLTLGLRRRFTRNRLGPKWLSGVSPRP